MIELPVTTLNDLSTLGLQPKVFKIQMNFDTSKKDVGESWWIFTENASRIAGRTGSQGTLARK
jgi:hypothetical protein